MKPLDAERFPPAAAAIDGAHGGRAFAYVGRGELSFEPDPTPERPRG